MAPFLVIYNVKGGAVASWLVRSSLERVVRVRHMKGIMFLFHVIAPLKIVLIVLYFKTSFKYQSPIVSIDAKQVSVWTLEIIFTRANFTDFIFYYYMACVCKWYNERSELLIVAEL